jgi:predicted transcriptional regulator
MSKIIGFTKVPNALARCGWALTHAEFRVLVFLMSLDPCHPSYDAISEGCDMSRSALWNAIKGLVEKGLLTYKKGAAKTHTANTYYVAADLESKIKALSEKKMKQSPKVF